MEWINEEAQASNMDATEKNMKVASKRDTIISVCFQGLTILVSRFLSTQIILPNFYLIVEQVFVDFI